MMIKFSPQVFFINGYEEINKGAKGSVLSALDENCGEKKWFI